MSPRKTRRRATDQDRRFAEWLYAAGVSPRAIGWRVGFSKSAVRVWLGLDKRKPYVKKLRVEAYAAPSVVEREPPDLRSVIVDQSTRIAWDAEDSCWRIEVIVARAGARPEWERILWLRFATPEVALVYLSGPYARIRGSC